MNQLNVCVIDHSGNDVSAKNELIAVLLRHPSINVCHHKEAHIMVEVRVVEGGRVAVRMLTVMAESLWPKVAEFFRIISGTVTNGESLDEVRTHNPLFLREAPPYVGPEPFTIRPCVPVS